MHFNAALISLCIVAAKAGSFKLNGGPFAGHSIDLDKSLPKQSAASSHPSFVHTDVETSALQSIAGVSVDSANIYSYSTNFQLPDIRIPPGADPKKLHSGALVSYLNGKGDCNHGAGPAEILLWLIQNQTLAWYAISAWAGQTTSQAGVLGNSVYPGKPGDQASMRFVTDATSNAQGGRGVFEDDSHGTFLAQAYAGWPTTCQNEIVFGVSPLSSNGQLLPLADFGTINITAQVYTPSGIGHVQSGTAYNMHQTKDNGKTYTGDVLASTKVTGKDTFEVTWMKAS